VKGAIKGIAVDYSSPVQTRRLIICAADVDSGGGQIWVHDPPSSLSSVQATGLNSTLSGAATSWSLSRNLSGPVQFASQGPHMLMESLGGESDASAGSLHPIVLVACGSDLSVLDLVSLKWSTWAVSGAVVDKTKPITAVTAIHVSKQSGGDILLGLLLGGISTIKNPGTGFVHQLADFAQTCSII